MMCKEKKEMIDNHCYSNLRDLIMRFVKFTDTLYEEGTISKIQRDQLNKNKIRFLLDTAPIVHEGGENEYHVKSQV